jgi:hypothetical protein
MATEEYLGGARPEGNTEAARKKCLQLFFQSVDDRQTWMNGILVSSISNVQSVI